MSLIKQILQLKRKKITFLTTPSHGQKPPFKSRLGRKYYSYDMSEVDGLDNLNYPEGCIGELRKKLSDKYCTTLTQPLTNGSSQGILALMLATLKQGDKVLVASNCHKSVHNGLVLTGAEPIWINPNYDENFGIFTTISPFEIEKMLEQHQDIRCLILTNPTYDGTISDTAKISEICKAKNVLFIVDEAHGALWWFDKTLGTPATFSGADASVQSLHKTCGAITPTALLHLSKNSRISTDAVLKALNVISTTSPSYPAIVNIEETTNFLSSRKGQNTLEKLSNNIMKTRKEIKSLQTIELLECNTDITKICVRALNMPAEKAAELIYSKFKLECEIQHARSMTFLCGIGTTKKKLEKLVKALKYINKISLFDEVAEIEGLPIIKREQNLRPADAYNAQSEEVLVENAVGKTCAQIITPYPPGIPVLTYGEAIKEEHLDYFSKDLKIRIVK